MNFLEKALSWYMVVLFPQYAENRGFLFIFSADGLHDSGYFIGYSFKISRNKASTIFYDTALGYVAILYITI